MVNSPKIGEVYHDGEGGIVVVDENGDVKPTDDYIAELDLSSDAEITDDKFDEEAYINEIRKDKINAIANAAIDAVNPIPSADEYDLDLSAEDDRLTYAAALKRIINDREAEIAKIEATPEYQREEQTHGYYNDNSPVEYDPGRLHNQTWNMTLDLLPIRHELRRVEEIAKEDKL